MPFNTARKAALSLAVVAPLTLGLAPAHAGNNSVSVAGTDTISPGLPCPPSGCALHLDFTALFAGQDASGTATCTFDGTDTYWGGATVLHGSGSGTVSCSGGVRASGTLVFVRTGFVGSLSGNLTVNGGACTTSITLIWPPTSANPTTTSGFIGGGTVTC
jgi:hypothetical protein